MKMFLQHKRHEFLNESLLRALVRSPLPIPCQLSPDWLHLHSNICPEQRAPTPTLERQKASLSPSPLLILCTPTMSSPGPGRVATRDTQAHLKRGPSQWSRTLLEPAAQEGPRSGSTQERPCPMRGWVLLSLHISLDINHSVNEYERITLCWNLY